jgi:two-component system, NtrC family, response regulator HydG
VNPRLLVVAGPLKDSVLAIPEGAVPVGRDPANQISISDPSLSRRHCVLTRADASCTIQDLDSRNGTFVNGSAVKETVLQHGDQISAGDSVFILLLHNEEEVFSGHLLFDGEPTHATAQLRLQDAVYLNPDNVVSDLPATSRLKQNLAALLKISSIVHSIRDLAELESHILGLLFEVIPAESGAILMVGAGGKPTHTFVHSRSQGHAEAISVSRTVTRQVVEERIAILGSNVPQNASLSSVKSILISNIRSLLCVPLAVHEKTTGCIYLQSTNPGTRFDQDHLQIATAIAGISAMSLENSRQMQWLEQENARLKTEINLEHNMVGDSRRMKELYELLTKVAPADSTVLIEGESGTGKELVARAIHRNSARASQPFVTINCAAIPEGLLESELFGHEKGAFTGAGGQKKGKLEMADGGIAFLDEIGELAPALQVKLLRVLQEHEFERLGGTRSIPLDIRLIAATNKDLRAAIASDEFRQDLFYRLNVISIIVPPLRERAEDVPVLARYFTNKYGKKFGRPNVHLSEDAVAYLTNYDWPGNVRELENTIQRTLVLSSGDVIGVEDLPEAILEKVPPIPGAAKYHTAILELKKQLILKAFEEAEGSYTEAARRLGVHANYLHRLIRNLGMKDALRVPSSPREGKTAVPIRAQAR